ncbi:Pyruvate kinase 1 [Nymphon striatum]|nr:Pyruvate kinase 1 [Nymphon striatum]
MQFFAISLDVDWIALSFVRFAQDLIDLKKIIDEHSEHKIPIIAKIEKPEAVENIDKIVAYCDGLMVARGDLGVEVPAQEVPLIQKQLVLRAKKARIPVIIATQMMETMITSLTPTRAEVNDVANSVMDGADAVMLSGRNFCRKLSSTDHDSEVSCNGILFFGTQDLPIITIPKDQERKFNTLYEVFEDEFKTPDKIQGDMLQMLLKRLIIICTRLAKEQLIVKKLDNEQIDVVRKFNVLVDTHYKSKRKVSDYADLLFKSPKTLSNLFALYNQKSPQQIILERLALEAKRLIRFSNKQNQEIAYELGFNDPAHFSRFFKKMTNYSPTQYREIGPISA